MATKAAKNQSGYHNFTTAVMEDYLNTTSVTDNGDFTAHLTFINIRLYVYTIVAFLGICCIILFCIEICFKLSKPKPRCTKNYYFQNNKPTQSNRKLLDQQDSSDDQSEHKSKENLDKSIASKAPYTYDELQKQFNEGKIPRRWFNLLEIKSWVFSFGIDIQRKVLEVLVDTDQITLQRATQYLLHEICTGIKPEQLHVVALSSEIHESDQEENHETDTTIYSYTIPYKWVKDLTDISWVMAYGKLDTDTMQDPVYEITVDSNQINSDFATQYLLQNVCIGLPPKQLRVRAIPMPDESNGIEHLAATESFVNR